MVQLLDRKRVSQTQPLSQAARSESSSPSSPPKRLPISRLMRRAAIGIFAICTLSAYGQLTFAAAAPTVELSATPTTVWSGQPSVLRWSTANATSCTASGGWTGTKATSGAERTADLKVKTSFTLTCSGPGGTVAQSTTILMHAPLPSVMLSATPAAVSSGGATTLTWSTYNATSCQASGAWSGQKGTRGEASTGALKAAATYELTCTGTGGSASHSLTVSVAASTAAPTVALNATPSTVASGKASSLTWSATNATSCAASGGWSGTLATSGTKATAALTKTTSYTVSCSGAGGTAAQSATVTTTAATPAPTVSLNASPSSISSGSSATLTWSSTNATACTASGAWSGTVATSGTKSTGALSSSQTYNISCTGTGGTTQGSTIVTVTSASPTTAAAATCTGSSGALTLKASIPRASGISPLTVFFDATATTDSSVKAGASAFQDVQYSWNFGDTGTSGTGTWAYGSNPGHNSKNTASGGVAAHLYMTNGADKIYTVTVSANDGTNTASCQLGVTAYDPSGSNGFAGTNTTCVSASGTPTPGAGGCPAGAAVLSTSSVATAFSSALSNGKRVLFKCGDTFSSHNSFVGAVTKFTIGAYGGCENTQTNRPIFSFSGSADGSVILLLGVGSNVPGDGRLLDIDCEGNSLASQGCTSFSGNNNRIPYQMTQYNLRSNGSRSNYYWSHGAQMALINSVATGMQGAIGTFINIDGNGTGTWSGSPINNINYQAVLGNSLAGTGDTSGGGDEAVRIGACMYCVFANNTFKDGNTVGATFKLFESNDAGSGGSQTNFAGIPVQFVEISDNLFTGMSGAQLAEVSPQANSFDERFYDIVIERNLFVETHDNLGNFLLLSGERETVRDNVFYTNPGFSHPSFFNVQIAERDGPNCGSAPCPSTMQTTQHAEVYNNTGYALSFRDPQYLVAFDSSGLSGAAGSSSWVQNNLYYSVGSGAGVVDNAGSNNTISNNTTNTSANPGMVNASGSFSLISDFQPTANYTGGMKVPVLLDALNDVWPAVGDLGAVHP